MEEITKIQNWPIDENVLRFSYSDYGIKPLEEKAEWFHNVALNIKDVQLATVIRGNEKEEYTLNVLITRVNEKHKHQENTHLQETDL